MVNIVYYTSGTTGSGRLVKGLSIGTALARSGVSAEFTIISSSPFSKLADILSIRHVEIPVETEDALSENNYKTSILFRTLSNLEPDILLVDLMWFSLYSFIDKMSCKKIFLSRQVSDTFFSIPLEGGQLDFDPSQYDKLLVTEPFIGRIPMDEINPFIIRNRDEILEREAALERLGLQKKQPACLLAYNGHPGDFINVRNTYSYLEEEGYQMVYSTNYDGGIFPVVDYFNAFDLIICGAGYNAFWEVQFFKKEAIIVPTNTQFEDQQKRIDECNGMTFEENGADQLVDLMLSL